MSARGDFRDSAREEERRKRDEAKVQVLQAQLDELRALSRELVSRQARLEDQLKASEANVAQQRLLLEQHRHEVSQSAQARQLEEGRFRQQLVELGTRIDDSTRPIRSLQAHVAELLEATRRQRDDVGQDAKRFDELRVMIGRPEGRRRTSPATMSRQACSPPSRLRVISACIPMQMPR